MGSGAPLFLAFLLYLEFRNLQRGAFLGFCDIDSKYCYNPVYKRKIRY